MVTTIVQSWVQAEGWVDCGVWQTTNLLPVGPSGGGGGGGGCVLHLLGHVRVCTCVDL